MKKLILLLPFLLIPLTSCNQSAPLPEPSLPDVTDGNDERNYKYTNKLSKPSFTVSNMQQLSEAVDYCAFYKIEYFDITLDNYVWSTNKKNWKEELNYLYWYCELINGVMGMNAETISNNVLRFKLTFYKNAYKDTSRVVEQMNQIVDFSFNGDRDDSWNDFATEDLSKPVVDVATSQQLWYAAEHGYRINPIEYSPADYYYDQAKDLLRHAVLSTSSNEDKMASIYDYVISTCAYDYEALQYYDSDNPDLYPDVNSSAYKAYYLEGYFDNNLVVCDGYSKLLTLLGRMEGLEIVRAIGTQNGSSRWDSRSIAGHAYTYFKNADNKWYLCCPTWGQVRLSGSNNYVLNHAYYMAPKSRMAAYENESWPTLNYATSYDCSYYSKRKFSYDNKEYDLLLSSIEETQAVLETLRSSSDGFIDVCVDYSAGYPQVNDIAVLIFNMQESYGYITYKLNSYNYLLIKF